MGARRSTGVWDGLRAALDPDPEVVLLPDTRPAAVLLPLVESELPSMVFTRRAEAMSRHAGEISFPGGLQHPEDSDLTATALRETDEELGLPSSHVEVLGALEPVHTYVTGILIVPYVGLLRARPAFIPSPAEIAEVLEYPIGRLAEVETERHYEHELGRWVGFEYVLDGNTIWGATGRILHTFLEILREEASWTIK